LNPGRFRGVPPVSLPQDVLAGDAEGILRRLSSLRGRSHGCGAGLFAG
jgi:hypothetical protein